MEPPTNLLIISRDSSLNDTIKRALTSTDFNPIYGHPEEDFLALVLEKAIRIVLVDAAPGPAEAGPLSVLKKLKRFDPMIEVAIVGGDLGPEAILGWIHMGASDYFTKPLGRDVLCSFLQRVSQKSELRKETYQLEKKLEKKYVFQGMISRNPGMMEVFSLIENIAKYFTTVLLTGETGTGKEMAARAIHNLSPYRGRKLVIADCTSIPENLFESELFGYRKGAFTGADKDKKGLFEEAEGGIIFLDEIAEIPVTVQAKLLRVLENHQFRPLGANESRTVDVHVIAATNRDLQRAIKNGSFREDLFHRLNKVEIHIPPLKDRLEDIPLLVRHFIQSRAWGLSKSLKGVSRDVQKLFLRYSWPGNIRELENVLESAVLVCKKEFIDVSDLPKPLREIQARETPPSFVRKEGLFSLEELEKEYIIYLLKFTKNNLRRAAKILGVSRTTLYNKMAKFKLSR